MTDGACAVVVCGDLAAQAADSSSPTAQRTPLTPRRNDSIGSAYSSIRSIRGSKLRKLEWKLPSKTAHKLYRG